VVIAGDGTLGQMMEPVTLPPMRSLAGEPPAWALGATAPHAPRRISSFYLAADQLEEANLRLQAKLRRIEEAEQRYDTYEVEDADVLLVAFGSVARIAQSAVRQARRQGLKVGLFRPISLWPFPAAALAALAQNAAALLVVEMNAGQMLQDVRLACGGSTPIRFMGHMGGVIPLPEEIVSETQHLMRTECHPVHSYNGTGHLRPVQMI
jgi:2-oxoglutarate ferredoxin oxidoreductase subunit alpha